MKLRHAMPVLAAFALAACGGDAEDDLADEALSMDEVAAQASELEMRLEPGEYRSTAELIEFDMPELPAETMALARQAFAEGAASESTYCLTEQSTPEQWISQMNESDCTVSRFDSSDGALDAVLQCRDAEGMNGRVEMNGTADGTSADLEMRFRQQIPGLGEGTIHMRVKSERIGDCA